MKFILRNAQKDTVYNIETKNDRVLLSCSDGNIEYKGIELNTPVQYFILDNHTECKNGDVLIAKKDLEEGKMFDMRTYYEQDVEINYNFKYASNILKRRRVNGVPMTLNADLYKRNGSSKLQFNIENEILPEFNKNAENPNEIYNLYNLFPNFMLKQFGHMSDEDLGLEFNGKMKINELTQHIASKDIEYKTILYNAMGVHYKLLLSTIIDFENRLPKSYMFMKTLLSENLVKKRLTNLERDKLLAKFYVMVLLANNLEIELSRLPLFREEEKKIKRILQYLGCRVTASGNIKLVRVPNRTCLVG